MSGLATLLAYEDEEDDEDRQRPHHAAEPTSGQQSPPLPPEPSQPPQSPRTPSHSLTSASAARVKSSLDPSTAVETAAESEEQKEVTASQPLQTTPPAVASDSAEHPRSSSPLITPQLHRLIARLPPIPTASLPSDPRTVHSYYAALPSHIDSLLHKRRTTRSSSLIEQLTALPAFHNPAILQRILDTRHINQHDTLWTAGSDTDEQMASEDSVDGMNKQPECEQREREKREEEQRNKKEAAAEQERRQWHDRRHDEGSGKLDEASVVSWRERELRKRHEAAMHTAAPASTVAPVSSAVVTSGAAAAVTDAKRLEAMRRAEEINKRLRKSVA